MNLRIAVSAASLAFISNTALAQTTPPVAPAIAPAAKFSSSQYFPEDRQQLHAELEDKLLAVPSRQSLRAFHDQFGSEPHLAGTPGDERNIQRLAFTFRMLGMNVDVHEFWAYLAKPVDAAVQIVSPVEMTLSVKEEALKEDRFSHDPALTIGFNAYSASGDVTAPIVYANYGTQADFEALKKLGIDCSGKIVMARYGGNFRGYKAKFAQEAGAAGLLIYTDPDDSGYRRGVPYPEGGFANGTAIQRGSIITLDYPGDPLTPGRPAVENADRLKPEDVALPRIPVQPIGYGAAGEIMSRMTGRALPPELIKTWQGGLPFAYRLEGGDELRVRLMVQQERAITKSANVIATIWGQTHPLEKIIIGCHHDAWCHGAGDPLAGTILLYEAAKSFFEMTQTGFTPARTIVFAAWGAEEYGIIGSTEYCEQFKDDLIEGAVAYINLDAAAMGPNFGSSASPSLKKLIAEVARDVPQTPSESPRSVYQAWLGESEQPSFGNLGGGSDHIGFYCHLGIPSCAFGAGGAQGVAYHSNYDNLHWYRKVVGDDYQPAIMLTRIVNLLTARLAQAPLLPLDPVQYAADTRTHLEALRKRAGEVNLTLNDALLLDAINSYENQARATIDETTAQMKRGLLDAESLEVINKHLLNMERDWLRPVENDAATQRPWFRNLFAASDPNSGYAAWMLPGLREAIEAKSADSVSKALDMYVAVFERLSSRLEMIDSILKLNVELEKDS